MKMRMLPLLLMSASALTANQAIFYTSNGEAYSLDIETPSSVWEIKEVLEEILPFSKEEMLLVSDGAFLCEEEYFLPEEGQEIWVTSFSHDQPIPKKTYAGYRDYDKKATESEKEDLRYIMKIMATKSVASLLKYRTELEAAGDRIDRVHPLRFLETVFTDEELKVYMHNIRKRGGWIWGEFIKGLKGSLQDEAEIGNMTDDMIFDFSCQVGIDISKIQGQIHGHKWEDFIKSLIIHIPREGDSDRYDQ
jgi:hypothetical protein